MSRRFPPPWPVVEIAGGSKVIDSNGFQLAYVYAREDLMMRTDHLSPAEAQQIARAIARLPELWHGTALPQCVAPQNKSSI